MLFEAFTAFKDPWDGRAWRCNLMYIQNFARFDWSSLVVCTTFFQFIIVLHPVFCANVLTWWVARRSVPRGCSVIGESGLFYPHAKRTTGW